MAVSAAIGAIVEYDTVAAIMHSADAQEGVMWLEAG